MGYTASIWLGFGEVLAAVAGALTGLLFVALSVKSDVLSASRSLSSPRRSNPGAVHDLSAHRALGRWWLVLAAPRHRGESRGGGEQRVAVPRQSDQLNLLNTPVGKDRRACTWRTGPSRSGARERPIDAVAASRAIAGGKTASCSLGYVLLTVIGP